MLLGEPKRETPVWTKLRPSEPGGDLIQAKRCAFLALRAKYDAFLKKSATGQFALAQLALASSFPQKVVD